MTAKNDHPELLAQLEEGIAKLTSSDAWLDYLVFQSRFHRYSFGNVLLIAAQDGGATRVAGFQAWRQLNRVVRKGEKAIWILAPMVGKKATTAAGEDETVIRGFKYVPVFDIAQTEGSALPNVCTKLAGEDPQDSYGRFLAVAASIGFQVEDHRFGDDTNGDCTPSVHRIRIEIRNSPAQRVKTLAHELAHALLHHRVEDRALAELEAESTAYVVCRQVGLDTSDYTFGYLAVWAGDGAEAIAGIKKSGERIQRAAATILRLLEAGQEQAA